LLCLAPAALLDAAYLQEVAVDGKSAHLEGLWGRSAQRGHPQDEAAKEIEALSGNRWALSGADSQPLEPAPTPTSRLLRAEPKPEVDDLAELQGSVSEEETANSDLIDYSAIRSLDDSLLDSYHFVQDKKPEHAPTEPPPKADEPDIEYRAYPTMPVDNLCKSTMCKEDDDCSGRHNFGCRCQLPLISRESGCWHCRCVHQFEGKMNHGCHPRSNAKLCQR